MTNKKPQKYIEISPDDKEVLEILNQLNKEFETINVNQAFELKTFKKYSAQAKKLLNQLESCEKNIQSTMQKIDDFSSFTYTSNKNFIIYAAYVKKATLFVYEFRTWVTKQEIQMTIQFEDTNKQLKYAQVKLQDIIANTKLYLQKGKKMGLATSKTRLQITNQQLQNISSDFILNNDVALRLGTFTKSIKKIGEQKGYRTGRLFETILENLANNVDNISDENFKWTIKDRIPALRAGDLSSEVVEKLIKLGILHSGNLKELEISLKTVTQSAENTEIQNVNMIKNELFNIIALIETGFDSNTIQKTLNKMFRDTSKSGTPYQVRKSIAQSLGLVVNDSLSNTLDELFKK